MTFARVLRGLTDELIELRPQGFFNVENGKFAVSTKYFPQCDCYVTALGFTDCQKCGRGNGNTNFTFPSGDGDGIFVAYEIVMLSEESDEEDVTIGMLAIFDYQFQIANAARQAIENETVPKFPWELALQFENCKGIEVGVLEVARALFIGNSPFSWNGKDAVVDFPWCVPGDYKAVVFCEEVDASVEGIAERLSSTQGSNRENVERLARIAESTFDSNRAALGISPTASPFSPIVPRAVVVLHEELSLFLEGGENGEIDEFEINDWNLLAAQFRLGKIDLAHKKSMTESVIWENVLLAREYDRAAGQCSDAEAMRLHLRIRSWLYLGRYLGMENCINFLAGFKYEPSAEEEILMLMRRGLGEEANKYL
jgi:hypothetical protein